MPQTEKQKAATAGWKTHYKAGNPLAPRLTPKTNAPATSWWTRFAQPGSRRADFAAAARERQHERLTSSTFVDRTLRRMDG